DGQLTLRQQVTLQMFIPIGQAILEAYERFDPLDLNAEIDTTFGEMLSQTPTRKVLEYVNTEIQRELPDEETPF
ncbi:virulence factor SrfB, partial [Pectobacterium carotovorum]